MTAHPIGRVRGPALLPGPEPKGRILQAREVNGQIGLKPLWNMAL
jgi:hypothetical protein